MAIKFEGERFPIKKQESSEAAAEKKLPQERFNDVLKNKFDLIPPGCKFSSHLKGVDSINILPSPNKNSAFAMVFYKRKDRGYHTTFNIRMNGAFDGKIPEELRHLTQEDIYNEILDDLDKIGLDFWFVLDENILPPGKGAGGKKIKSGEGGEPRPEEPERIDFLRHQSELLLKFTNKKEGLSGYRGFIFPNFCVLENSEFGNAAYFIDFDAPLENRQKIISDEQAADVFAMPWTEKLQKTKVELRTMGALRIEHRGEEDEWKKIMQRQIDMRLDKLKRE